MLALRGITDNVSKCASSVNVTTHSGLAMAYANGQNFVHGGSGWLSVYNADQKAAIQTLTDAQDDVYYLFFVDNAVKLDPDGNRTIVAGYMPICRRYGFIYDSPTAKYIAHELGHGAFHLWHTFSDENKYVAPQGATTNLMDYNGTTTDLYKYQWDYIHNPEFVLFRGDDEEGEGLYEVTDGSYIVRNGKIINGSVIKKYPEVQSLVQSQLCSSMMDWLQTNKEIQVDFFIVETAESGYSTGLYFEKGPNDWHSIEELTEKDIDGLKLGIKLSLIYYNLQLAESGLSLKYTIAHEIFIHIYRYINRLKGIIESKHGVPLITSLKQIIEEGKIEGKFEKDHAEFIIGNKSEMTDFILTELKNSTEKNMKKILDELNTEINQYRNVPEVKNYIRKNYGNNPNVLINKFVQERFGSYYEQ